MSYTSEFRKHLEKRLGKSNVTFYPTWDKKVRGIGWKGTGGKPVALLCHHTAGAGTTSTVPKHVGNSKTADQPQATFIQKHAVPYANFTVGRSGHVWVHSLYPVHHAGLGTFKGTPFARWGVPKNMGNDYMLGVECVSKGLKKDFTQREKDALGALANACRDACGWTGFKYRLPNHKTWAPTRKIDTRYTLSTLRAWALRMRKP